ncbi:agamous-like MADS-box protein TM6 isoform X2 [Salvia splendens]|uniref:agamous-like MADS-box protein TM6 isoform X2 n=1 Tax=Salvia splendens TaxID=180675 RepID=UPI001C2776A3|nr:agamous-like MADS-box protein TM6 isoform X2 [Salvia splendens]
MDSFSMKKDEILKEAKKITRLCDAEVSIILLTTHNFYLYTSPTSSMKKIIDQYQSTVGVDLWSSHYEKMQEELGRLKDENTALKREIMQRRGEEVDGMDIKELCNLEEEMLNAAKIIQTRKNLVMRCRIDTYRKKEEAFERRHGRVLDQDGFDSAAAFAGIVHPANPVPVQQLAHLRIDEGKGSCVTTEAMEVEYSD